VGADGDDDGGTDQGAVWLLFLDANGAVKSDRKISATTGGFGGPLHPSDRFGCAVADAGDLGGDGVHDLVVGARLADQGGNEQGAMWVLLLASDGSVTASHPIAELTGGFAGDLVPGDRFGSSVAPLGDIDGDGAGDFAVGATANGTGGTNQGAV